jgi:hypothetical protein
MGIRVTFVRHSIASCSWTESARRSSPGLDFLAAMRGVSLSMDCRRENYADELGNFFTGRNRMHPKFGIVFRSAYDLVLAAYQG